AASAAATRALTSASRARLSESAPMPAATPAIASPTARPRATNPEAFVSLTPATRWVLQPGHFLAPIASGRWQLGQEKTVCSISPIDSDSEIMGGRGSSTATFVVLRVRRRAPPTVMARSPKGRRREASCWAQPHGESLHYGAGRPSVDGPVGAVRSLSAACGAETQSRQIGLRPSIVRRLMGDPTPLLDALDAAGF